MFNLLFLKEGFDLEIISFLFLCLGHINEAEKLDEAAALPASASGSPALAQSRLQQEETDAAIALAVSATLNGAEGGGGAGLDIDEDLFAGEDIDLIEEDLETLDLEDEES